LISGAQVKLKIRHKLFLTLLLTSTVVAGVFFAMLQWSFDRGFLNYVNRQENLQLDQLTTQLVDYYARQGDWKFIIENHPLWRKLHESTFSLNPQQGAERFRPDTGHGPKFSPPPRDPRNIGPRVILYNADKEWVIGGGPRGKQENPPIKPIKHEDGVIGYLGFIPVTELSHTGDLLFVEEQTETFGLVALVMICISMLLTFPLTFHLLRPIKELASGTRKLISGQFTTRIALTTKDELGQLSEDFNCLAMTLEKNERTRRQLIADISHELRTPLSVLRGEVEALQDGIRQPGPQTLDPLHSEILHLERLVNDLFELSMSDIGALNYKRVKVNPIGILAGTLEFFEQRFTQKGLNLNATLPDNFHHYLFGDPDRLQQLFTNLLENSLRYTNTPGELRVSIKRNKDKLIIYFQDSGPGVEPEQLPKLFDRLFRADPSRNRKKGGAGLGLSICNNIVEAHQGTIKAFESALGGLEIRITFPINA